VIDPAHVGASSAASAGGWRASDDVEVQAGRATQKEDPAQ